MSSAEEEDGTLLGSKGWFEGSLSIDGTSVSSIVGIMKWPPRQLLYVLMCTMGVDVSTAVESTIAAASLSLPFLQTAITLVALSALRSCFLYRVFRKYLQGDNKKQ